MKRWLVSFLLRHIDRYRGSIWIVKICSRFSVPMKSVHYSRNSMAQLFNCSRPKNPEKGAVNPSSTRLEAISSGSSFLAPIILTLLLILCVVLSYLRGTNACITIRFNACLRLPRRNMGSKRGMSRTIREKEVDLFESKIGCFGVEEPDDLGMKALAR